MVWARESGARGVVPQCRSLAEISWVICGWVRLLAWRCPATHITGRPTRSNNCRRRLRRKGCCPVASNVSPHVCIFHNAAASWHWSHLERLPASVAIRAVLLWRGLCRLLVRYGRTRCTRGSTSDALRHRCGGGRLRRTGSGCTRGKWGRMPSLLRWRCGNGVRTSNLVWGATFFCGRCGRRFHQASRKGGWQ
jgi:hypothetical protein